MKPRSRVITVGFAVLACPQASCYHGPNCCRGDDDSGGLQFAVCNG